MGNIILSPPIAFLILLAVILLIMYVSRFMAAGGSLSAGKGKPYASGEDYKARSVQPDYRQFFPFAFFFTIMHVVALIVATVPDEISLLAFLYIFVAFLALYILFRK